MTNHEAIEIVRGLVADALDEAEDREAMLRDKPGTLNEQRQIGVVIRRLEEIDDFLVELLSD